jgi:hypothetical protein
MVNEDFTPGQNEEDILSVLSEGRGTPNLLKSKTGLNGQQIDYALNKLIAAGWVKKVTTGLYELKEDPRVPDESDVGDVDQLRSAVDDAREAHEELNGDDLAEALDRLDELVRDIDGDP